MANSPTLLCIVLAIISSVNDAVGVGAQEFIYNNGFKDTNLFLGGAASITQDGILSLTSGGSDSIGYGFHREPLPLLGYDGKTTKPSSFSATIVFTVTPFLSGSSSDKLAFEISPTNTNFSSAGFFAIALGGNLQNPACISSAYYSYADDLYNVGRVNREALRLSSGKPVQLWADYNGKSMMLKVILTLVPMPKPSPPLLYYAVNMSRLLLGDDSPAAAYAYAGFSASTGVNTTYQVLGWSFSLGGEPAPPLKYSLLPSLGVHHQIQGEKKKTMKDLIKWLPATISTLTVLVGITDACLQWRNWRENYEGANWLDKNLRNLKI